MRGKLLKKLLPFLLAAAMLGETVYASELPEAQAEESYVTAESETEASEEVSEESAETLEEVTEEGTEATEESGEVTEEATEESGEATEEAPEESGEATEEAPEESGEATEETTEESGEATEEAPEESGEATEETSEESGEATEEASEESGEATEEAPEESGEATEEVTEESMEASEEDTQETLAESGQAPVSTPQFVIKGIFGGRSVTFTCDTEDAVIYYKSGSSDITLTDASAENGETIYFTSFYGTIYARAYKDGVWSDIAKFVLKIPVVNTPQISAEGNRVTIKTTTPSSYICYTTDGSKPSWENGKRISGSGGTVTVEEGSVVRAVAVRSCFSDSAEVKLYIPVMPAAFQVKGIFGGRNVTMTSETDGAVIYYSTTTGSITTADKMLKNGESIDFTDFYGTVYARAYKNGKWSNVSRLILKIPTINTPIITVTDNRVTVMTTTPSCYICYTTDGSDPSPTHGTRVFGSRVSFQAPAGSTVKAMAIRSCFTNSQIVSAYVKSYDRQVLSGSSGGDNYTPVSYQSTARWSHVMRSYLYQNADGTVSVVDASSFYGTLNVDTYSKNWQLQSTRSISMELPLFGGFYAGTQYNYIVFGQRNPDMDDSVITYKVVKYDKNWKRLGAADYSDNNTTIPFDAGSLRMAEDGGYLYIRTCHEMYSGHQANVTFSVNTAAMNVADEFSSVWNIGVGYVSHSFNQFIAIDDGYLVGVDHGDGFPRAVVLVKSPNKVTDGKFTSGDGYQSVALFSIPGSTGANCTGVTVGGFEVSEDNYLVAINTIDHSKVTEYTSFNMTGLDVDERDIVLLVSAKDNLDEEQVKSIKLTNYVNNGKLGSTPYLVKIADDKYMVMWEEFSYEEIVYSWGWTSYDWVSAGVKYVVVDGKGNKLTDVMTMADAELSYNCQPMYINNEVIWYVNETDGRRFYRIYVV